jgi:KDO2-lipid IV(A) lauroyltransferase
MKRNPVAELTTPLHKRIKRFVRYGVIRLLVALAQRFPIRRVSDFGAWLGQVAFWAARRQRLLAMRHVALAFPDKGEGERARIVRSSFAHLGRCVGELVCVRQIDASLDDWVEWPAFDRQQLDAALARGKGVVFVSGHIGNWELTARGVTARGYDGASIARQASDPRTTALIEGLRKSGNLRSIWRGRPGAAKDMLRQLRDGKILGLLIDQDTKVQSVFVPFFGQLASTPRAAADLALKTGAAVIVGTCVRVDRFRYRLSTREVTVSPHENDENAVVALTAQLTRLLESTIRAFPEQWVWMHERWKRQPVSQK